MSTLSVDIMSPERLVTHTGADSVVVPAVDGELGILYNHTPLLAQLVPGEIRLRRGDSLESFAISGGFVEVVNNHISIFAETAEMAQEIDLERARQAAERAKAELRAAKTDMDLAQAEASLRRAMVRLHVTEGLRRSPKSTYR